jgi:adenine deaminase
VAKVELPIAGLLSPEPVDKIGAGLRAFARALRGMGVDRADPVSALTLMALAVSPEVKVTDLGLVDVVDKRLLETVVSTRSMP